MSHPPERPPAGLFVVFEGGEGTGKSTQAKLLAEELRARRTGREIVTTAEPGSTELGQRIREMVLSAHTGPMDPHAETALYLADRADHVSRVIRPALERGAIVICDRFADSTIVYQGYARRLGETRVEEMSRWAAGNLEPDLVFVLDLDPVEGLARAVGRSTPDRFERENLAFHERVRQGYLNRVARNIQLRAQDVNWHTTSPLYVLVDATYDAEWVANQVRHYVGTLILALAAGLAHR